MRNVLIGIGIAVLFFALGGLGGWKLKEKQVSAAPEEHSAYIDSLKVVNEVLQDSLNTLKAQDQEQVKTVVKWKTKYDTIRPQTDLTLLIRGLTQIAETPPQ